MMPVTPRQREILNFIESFQDEHDYAPSYAEIAKELKLNSLATVHKHIANLESRGAIKRTPHRSRTMEIVSDSTVKPRFEVVSHNRLWDHVLHCYWFKGDGEKI